MSDDKIERKKCLCLLSLSHSHSLFPPLQSFVLKQNWKINLTEKINFIQFTLCAVESTNETETFFCEGHKATDPASLDTEKPFFPQPRSPQMKREVIFHSNWVFKGNYFERRRLALAGSVVRRLKEEKKFARIRRKRKAWRKYFQDALLIKQTSEERLISSSTAPRPERKIALLSSSNSANKASQTKWIFHTQLHQITFVLHTHTQVWTAKTTT